MRIVPSSLLCPFPFAEHPRPSSRSFELESEIKELRRQLAAQAEGVFDWPLPTPGVAELPISPINGATNASAEPGSAVISNSGDPIEPLVQRTPRTAITTSTTSDQPEHSRVPGLTTRPQIDEPQERRRTSMPVAHPRTLDNIELSVQEIDTLFLMYGYAPNTRVKIKLTLVAIFAITIRFSLS